MRKLAVIAVVAALVLLTASVVSARCLDESCRAVRPTATATLLPLWTVTPSQEAPAVLELPPTAAMQGGYPGAPAPSSTPVPASATTAMPPCALLWTLRPAPDAERYLANCITWHLANGYASADICPPSDSVWAYLCAPTD